MSGFGAERSAPRCRVTEIAATGYFFDAGAAAFAEIWSCSATRPGGLWERRRLLPEFNTPPRRFLPIRANRGAGMRAKAGPTPSIELFARIPHWRLSRRLATRKKTRWRLMPKTSMARRLDLRAMLLFCAGRGVGAECQGGFFGRRLGYLSSSPAICSTARRPNVMLRPMQLPTM